VDVNVAMEQALNQAVAAAGDSQVRVVKHLAVGLPPIPAQRAQVEECFLNLIQNAFEAMPGGGTLTVGTRYAGNAQIEVVVADTGRGVEPEAMARLFDAFYTTKPGGTGLGLAIVKNLVENYGGTITVNSQVNAGARFTILLPVHLSNMTED